MSISLSAQNVVGMKVKELESYFKVNYPELSPEPDVKNDYYRYLKFSDASSNKVTALVFINDKGRCSAVRFIYDLSMEKKVLEELDSRFIKAGEKRWVDRSRKKEVVIYYEKEEWYITVNFKEEKEIQ